MAVFVVIFLLSIGFWTLVFSKRARSAMPLVLLRPWWLKKGDYNLTEEERDLQDGMTQIIYLLAAMITTLLWVTPFLIFVFGALEFQVGWPSTATLFPPTKLTA